MVTNEDRIHRVRKEVIDRYAAYSGCPQAVLGALQDEFGIGNKESFKAATALAGGIAQRGETCGAIIGALSALGLVMGRERLENTEAFRSMMEPSREICDRFREELKKRFGFKGELESTLCKDIQQKIFGKSFKMWTKEGLQEFLDAGGRSKTAGCPVVCEIAAQLAAEKIIKLI
ncbi:MAG: C-GCAxxG-C-C family protein [Dehalococcoidales bacterium]|nr:C-GCAxxG-C-C family protein [Dehalococcoidales bacterium]